MLMNSPPEIAREYINSAIYRVHLPLPKLIVQSIYAGFFISCSAICTLACSYCLTGGDGRYYAGLVAPIGVMLCLCLGAELFTANCLLVIPVFCKKISIIDMLINWGITFLCNFLSCLIMAVLMVYGHVTHLFDYALASYLVSFGMERTSLSFGDAFVKGILGNFCLCLAVWLSFGAKDLFSKIAALWTPIALIRACGFEHLVDNMFYIPAALFAYKEYDLAKENLDWGRYFYKNLIPVLLGNLVGGTVLVGFGYWYIYLTPDDCCRKNNENNNVIPLDKNIQITPNTNQNMIDTNPNIVPNNNQNMIIDNQNMLANTNVGN